MENMRFGIDNNGRVLDFEESIDQAILDAYELETSASACLRDMEMVLDGRLER